MGFSSAISGLAPLHKMAALKLRELRAGNRSFKINYLAAAGPSVARRTLIFAGK